MLTIVGWIVIMMRGGAIRPPNKQGDLHFDNENMRSKYYEGNNNACALDLGLIC